MKFPELLVQAIQRSEIPLRFEPGAQEAIAQPILDLLRIWLQAHEPEEGSELITQLIAELDGQVDVPE